MIRTRLRSFSFFFLPSVVVNRVKEKYFPSLFLPFGKQPCRAIYYVLLPFFATGLTGRFIARYICEILPGRRNVASRVRDSREHSRWSKIFGPTAKYRARASISPRWILIKTSCSVLSDFHFDPCIHALWLITIPNAPSFLQPPPPTNLSIYRYQSNPHPLLFFLSSRIDACYFLLLILSTFPWSIERLINLGKEERKKKSLWAWTNWKLKSNRIPLFIRMKSDQALAPAFQ